MIIFDQAVVIGVVLCEDALNLYTDFTRPFGVGYFQISSTLLTFVINPAHGAFLLSHRVDKNCITVPEKLLVWNLAKLTKQFSQTIIYMQIPFKGRERNIPSDKMNT